MGRVSLTPRSPQPPSGGRSQRGLRRLLVIAIAVVVVLVGAGGWWAWGQRNPPEISGNPTE